MAADKAASALSLNSLMSGKELVDSWLKELKDWVLFGVELPLFSLGFLLRPLMADPAAGAVGVSATAASTTSLFLVTSGEESEPRRGLEKNLSQFSMRISTTCNKSPSVDKRLHIFSQK